MRKLKIVFKTLLCMVHGFFSGFCTPILLSVAFNFTKGIANNPDGELSIPIGIAILLTILIIDILIIVKTVRSRSLTRSEKVLIISLFAIAKFAGLMVLQDEWRDFIECFMWKFNREEWLKQQNW